MADFTFAHREEGFDEHIENSIRGYSNLLNDIISFSTYFVEDSTNIVDIGCSTGKLTEAILDKNKDFAKEFKETMYIGIEVAEGFFKNLDDRLKQINDKYDWAEVDFIKDDVRNYKFDNCNLVTSIFTLQFMPKQDRQKLIEDIYNGLNPGGAFIFAEKTICEDARFQDMLTFNYYDYKRKSFTTDDILNKEITLRHMMKPNTYKEIEQMLSSAGFKNIQPFWRNFMFVGILAVK